MVSSFQQRQILDKRFHLVFPLMMGLEVLLRIRRQLGSRIVVIILTSSALESDIEKAYALGANAFLVKPTSISELQSMLKGSLQNGGLSLHFQIGRAWEDVF